MVWHKFHSIRTENDGISFASKKESAYYSQLMLAKKSGELLFFLRQIPFHLPGGVKYVCDFMEFWKNGEVRFTEIKGMETPMWKMKKRLVEQLYPIEIIVL